MYLADLHIHSKYAMATSSNADAPHLDAWARRKGIRLVGTGDLTHPGWRQELHELLEPAEEGFYTLKDAVRLAVPAACGEDKTRFVLSGEISSIYKKNGKTRKVHNVILLPSLAAADALSLRLERIGNIHSDGRPILGLDSRDLLEILLETCPDGMLIPAHIWTPHFALFGAFSGFDTIEECFEDLTGHIHALETGLSSDPPMNWQVSALDRFTLVSNSDAHSPEKLGREANLIDAVLSYPALRHAIETGSGFAGTLEFFPEEGKYHLDGHRNCGVRLTPAEAERLGGLCPVCGKRLTVGVQHRVFELADRPEGTRPAGAKPFESIVPLPEVIAAALGTSTASKAVRQSFEALLDAIGPEFRVLREVPREAIEHVAGPLVAEGVMRLREGRVERVAGYDGEFGRVILFDDAEREELRGQTALFGMPKAVRKGQREPMPQKPQKSEEKIATDTKNAAEAPKETLNAEQYAAVTSTARALAVTAGPGTGKTKTLVARTAYLLETRGVPAERITAVTFTNQAAAEMRARLEARLGGPSAIAGMTIGTFHAICKSLLPAKPLIGDSERIALLRELGAENPREAAEAISREKCGMQTGEHPAAFYAAYQARLQELGVRDLDDLLLDALDAQAAPDARFTHLLVDEYQDINAAQRKLVQRWSAKGESLFVIGDPDQSIYGFRGASAACFDELRKENPALETVTLSVNYRSTPEILSAATAVIAKNPGGERSLQAYAPSGARVRIVEAESPFAEGVFIAKELAAMTGGLDMQSARNARRDGGQIRAFSDVAVLARTHRQLSEIERCLRHDDIPCIVAGREEALSSDAVQGALAFFRFVRNPADTAALDTALRLGFGCDTACIRGVLQAARRGAEAPDALSKSGAPQEFLAAFEECKPLLDKERPERLIARYAAQRGEGEALLPLSERAVFFSRMPDFLDALLLGEEADIRRAACRQYTSGAVRLMTLHGAKGLEFPVVFLAGLAEGRMPLTRVDGGVDLEEERRLFFVGLTRAREELILTCPGIVSPFVKELPKPVWDGRGRARAYMPETKQMRLF